VIANFNGQNSTTATIIPPDNVVAQHTFVRFVIVGDDVKTAKSISEYEEINLHFRELEILKKQEELERKENLRKRKPKIKWYNQFKKHQKYLLFKKG